MFAFAKQQSLLKLFYSQSPIQSSALRKISWHVAIIMALFVVGLIFEKRTTANAEDSQPLKPPVSIEPGILYNNTGREELAPLEIMTKPGFNYYIKLVDLKSHADAFGVYVIGGIKSSFEVPLGDYELRYAAGSNWYGIIDHFGRDTIYNKANSIFSFTSDAEGYTGYTVELILQVDGNLKTIEIDKEDF